MHSLQIVELTTCPIHSARVLDWLRATWRDDHDEFATTIQPADDRPGALLALVDDVPVGVAAFKRYQTSEQLRPELWINALYVVPKHRRAGIGRRLVQAAVAHSLPRFAPQLFVYTDVPSLYAGLGWEHLAFSEEFGSHTLRFQTK